MKKKLFKPLLIVFILLFTLQSCQDEDVDIENNLIENAAEEGIDINDKAAIENAIRTAYEASENDKDNVDSFVAEEMKFVNELSRTNPTTMGSDIKDINLNKSSRQKIAIISRTSGSKVSRGTSVIKSDFDWRVRSCAHRDINETSHDVRANVINGFDINHTPGVFVEASARAHFSKYTRPALNRIIMNLYVWEWNSSKRRWYMKKKMVNAYRGPVHRYTGRDFISHFVKEQPRRTTYVYVRSISKLVQNKCGLRVSVPNRTLNVMYRIKS